MPIRLPRKTQVAQTEAADFEHLFDLLHKVSHLTAQTDDFGRWLRDFMKLICDFADWKIGHAWAPLKDDPNELVSIRIWHLQPGVNARAFMEKTETLQYASGVGLPGRVHQKKKVDWIPDVNLDDNYPRKPYANAAGFKGGYGCPVMVDGAVAAVIEFYDDRPADPSPLLIRTLEYLGMQVAPVLERSERARQRRELADALETRVASAVGEISQSALSMQQAAETAKTLSTTAQSRSRSSADASTRSSDQVRTVAAATGELSQAIRAIEGELGAARNTVAAAADRVVSANATFESLRQGAGEIEEVIGIINKIAEKTKLLSLNATIEASRAGALGAGFAVVASEVKDLAAQTETSTRHIAERVQDIQVLASEALQEFKAIAATIQDIRNSTESISGSVERQQRTTEAISANSAEAEGQSQAACDAVNDVVHDLASIDENSDCVLDTAGRFVARITALQDEVGSFLKMIRED
ncbi:methyl-accepting chemotaxis protein [Polymorphum gilvum]|uniref:Histidine kinase, HAMP region:Bacterial chemotaxis sensory transducer n=1 Tax=Polymorphum gilvum (strain LMG 25793 / CGMCC 1.9160 / SL003B-26A1) TaxID=991905 RepID=F2J2F3_POLGS|nr:methyl-accepting chemotaxis protein [Polymorphum gilvum]ADZ69849.1 Histidine kinase, HAMP region:Bacterial chemotaxis sensory transducer [Polymorphum gilvum SL003B-26A1]